MARHVIIHLPRIGEDRAAWAVADEAGRLVGEVAGGTLAEAGAAVEGRRATLVLPGDDVLLAEAVVPGGSVARAQQAIPFALEEQLADDVDELHFALGAKEPGDRWSVAVLGRATMERVVAQCAAAGLRPSELVPEPLVLPMAEDARRAGRQRRRDGRKERGGEARQSGSATTDELPLTGVAAGAREWRALLDGERAVVRLHGNRGFSCETAMLSLMLDGARRDLPVGEAATLVAWVTPGTVSPELPTDIEIEARPCESRFELYASALANAPHINLLQGDFNPKQRFDKAWKPWRWTAALAACLGLALLAGKWLDYRRLVEREAQLDAAIAETFAQALPGTRMQRPRRQMQSALERIGAGDGDTFIVRTSQIAESLATQPQTTLRSIGYRSGRFDLDLTTDALPTLDALKSEIEGRGALDMTVQSANREDDGVRGRVRIE